tara:strand:- start:26 stop:163 length:138 start_codon:yes stop_codon:yes gene_type:complete
MFNKSSQNKNTPLADRVTALEKDLKKTREMIQSDMKKLIEMVKKG